MTTTIQPQAQIDDQQSWQAVQARDSRFDGQFVYAVKSTGVYCRPSCPSRRPRPAQVQFFARPVDAQSAGFRACRRCLPDLPSAESRQTDLVRRACDYIRDETRDNPDGPPTLLELGRAVGASPSHLQRVFKKETGVTPKQYGQAWRLDRFKSLVRQGNAVSSAMYDAGFSSTSRLYENSEVHLGMSPGKYGKGAPGATIYHAVAECALGWLLVAATQLGVCSVKLGDDSSQLVEELGREFPAAVHQKDSELLESWVIAVLEYLEGRQPALDLPLDVRATAFQRRVWQLLQTIPYGETRTYQEVAREMGLENASRAVGRACASNPTALIVPCHRVLRKGGALGGYRWGLDRKEALLAMERRTQ